MLASSFQYAHQHCNAGCFFCAYVHLSLPLSYVCVCARVRAMEQLYSCLIAAKAALQMHKDMSDFTALGHRLTLHSGISAGLMEEVHFGGYQDRWEVCLFE